MSIPRIMISGTHRGEILNKVAGENHLKLLTEAVDAYNHIPVLGTLFNDDDIMIPKHHLA